MSNDAYLDVLFDGPPGPESGRFVEVNNPSGNSVNAGEWIERGDGLWVLRIPVTAPLTANGHLSSHKIIDDGEVAGYVAPTEPPDTRAALVAAAKAHRKISASSAFLTPVEIDGKTVLVGFGEAPKLVSLLEMWNG